MALFTLGTLSSVPASLRPDLLAEPTRLTLAVPVFWSRWAWPRSIRRSPIPRRPSISSGWTSTRSPTASWWVANAKETNASAACVVLADSRADINGVVKRLLDVRKASFLTVDRAVGLTGMEYGGITPIGLPAEWPVLIDRRVIETEIVVIGSGVRRSKILIPGSLLGELSQVEIIDGLGA